MRTTALGVAFALISTVSLSALELGAQERMPTALTGTWKIVRKLPTRAPGCWQGAQSLVGTSLTYRAGQMRWQGGSVRLTGVVTRTVTAEDFAQESGSLLGTSLKLSELNIMTPAVTEIDLQHEDADITGSTTEVPGDAVLLVGRNTIVVSACGTYFEANRQAASKPPRNDF